MNHYSVVILRKTCMNLEIALFSVDMSLCASGLSAGLLVKSDTILSEDVIAELVANFRLGSPNENFLYV